MKISFFKKLSFAFRKQAFKRFLKNQPNPVPGSKQNFSHATLEKVFEKILTGEMPVIQMTRSCGLQDKLIELFPEVGPAVY